MRRVWVGVVAVAVLAGCSSGGGSGGGSASTNVPSTTVPSTGGTAAPEHAVVEMVDEEVTFQSGGVTVHGSFRHPTDDGSGDEVTKPAVLLLAGSGPTDRNGDSTAVKGEVGTLKFLADRFEALGIPSLRYDKLGSGATGLADFGSRPADVDFELFVQEARDALAFLAAQPGVDAERLVLGGHSEGGLIALVVAGEPKGAPPPAALALFSPPTKRYLDLIADQVRAQLVALRDKGSITDAQVEQYGRVLDDAVAAVRAGTPLPPDLPVDLGAIFNATTAEFLRQGDGADPAELASRLTPTGGVLLSCAEKDSQVPCAGVETLAASFADVDLVRLPGADHVLKIIDTETSTGAEYGEDLPFTTDLDAPLRALVDRLG